jgi:hypothetical protein
MNDVANRALVSCDETPVKLRVASAACSARRTSITSCLCANTVPKYTATASLPCSLRTALSRASTTSNASRQEMGWKPPLRPRRTGPVSRSGSR